MRFLCLSDIHGNFHALEKVLQEAERREFDQLIVCGDLLFPGPNPLKTWKLLLERRALCVQGVGDRALAQIDPDSLEPTTDLERQRAEALEATHEELGELIVAHLGRLKPIARLPLESGQEMTIVHGSPADPMEPMTIDMSDEELYALLGSEPSELVICGGSHVPFDRVLDGGVRIVNVGSVGESPTPGIADATIIETFNLGFKVEQFVVSLD